MAYPATGDPIADAGLLHSWYFSDAVFHKHLAVTLRGTIDGTLIPTRVTAAGAVTQTLA